MVTLYEKRESVLFVLSNIHEFTLSAFPEVESRSRSIITSCSMLHLFRQRSLGVRVCAVAFVNPSLTNREVKKNLGPGSSKMFPS